MLAPSEGVMKKIYSPSSMKKSAKKPEMQNGKKSKGIEPSRFEKGKK